MKANCQPPHDAIPGLHDSLSKKLFRKLHRMIRQSHRTVSNHFIAATPVAYHDGIRTDPAALSTRTLLSSKRLY
jgi:hypothetical protein